MVSDGAALALKQYTKGHLSASGLIKAIAFAEVKAPQDLADRIEESLRVRGYLTREIIDDVLFVLRGAE